MALKRQAKTIKASEVKTEEKVENVKVAAEKAENKVAEKVEEVKEAAKKAVKPEEVKATAKQKAGETVDEVKKAAEKVTKAVEETAKEAKKTAEKVTKEVKKTAAKKADEVKKAAPKTATKKPAAKKEIKTEIVLQYGEKEVNTKDMIASVKKEWTKQKHKISEIKNIELYVKPEDYAVYYVINGEHTGKIWL